MSYEQRIVKLIESDELRMRALRATKTLGLPDWLIAAGFVRDIVWSSIYGHDKDLNDIDVVYHCSSDSSEGRDLALEKQLLSLEPELPWSVKNQARMHLRNRDAPYKSTIDAMGYWPEKQTAIGVQINDKEQVILRCAFGLDIQFNGEINYNPVRSIDIFNRRVKSKGWIESWPMLSIKT